MQGAGVSSKVAAVCLMLLLNCGLFVISPEMIGSGNYLKLESYRGGVISTGCRGVTFLVINASATTEYTLTPITFNTNGSVIDENYPKPVAYFWTFGDGACDNGTEVTHAYNKAGIYVVNLLVTTEDGGAHRANKTITILNRAPEARAQPLSPYIQTMERFFMDASQSSDADGVIVNYTWNFKNSANVTIATLYGKSVYYEYSDNGKYWVRLTVKDDNGATNTTDVEVEIHNRPPVLNYTVSNLHPNPGQLVYFNSSCTDLDGTVTYVEWQVYNNTRLVGSNVTYTYTVEGLFPVTLLAVDNDGAINTTVFMIQVGNRPPVPIIETDGANVKYTGEDFNFSANSSYDPDGRIISYIWNFGDDSLGATGINVTHSYAKGLNGAGKQYTVSLRVIDNDNNSALAEMVVFVLNRPPEAKAQDVVIDNVMDGPVVMLDGSQSSDPDGTIVKYNWSFGDGTYFEGGSSYSIVNHHYPGAGMYYGTLTVTDDCGSTNATPFIVVINNVLPVPNITYMKLNLNDPDTVSPWFFSGFNSSDPDGFITNYQWIFSDNLTYNTMNMTRTFSSNGTYTVRLIVTDNLSQSSETSISIRIGNLPPTAAASFSNLTFSTLTTINFDASPSSDPDGAITQYLWVFGDGGTATGMKTTHAYANNGVYKVVLTVVDDFGVADSVEILLNITNQPPVPVLTP
ncbi:MAG: PKD domain-containing protein, partial [Thermoplasmata archaeon]